MAPNAAEAFIESLKFAELVAPNGVIRAESSLDSKTGDATKKRTKDEEDRHKPEMQSVEVPSGWIVHQIPISRTTTLKIPLPPEMRDAERKRLKDAIDFLVFAEDADGGEP